MFQSLAGILGALTALAICAVALWRGRTAERWGAVVILAAWFASPLVEASNVFQPQWGVFWVDLAALAGFGLLLVVFRRGWLIFACAFQCLAVASHWAMLIDHRITMNTYLTGLAIWSLGVLASLFVGVLRRARPTKLDATHDVPRNRRGR